MTVLTFTWYTARNEFVCPFCRPLHGYVWTFDYDPKRDKFPETLVHPNQGVVWDTVKDEPLTHGEGSRRGPWNCRCIVVYRIDDPDLQLKLVNIQKKVEEIRNNLLLEESR